MRRKIILNFSLGTQGYPWAAWKHRSSDVRRVCSFEYFLEQAQLAEKGLFDCIFWVDHLGLVPVADAALTFPHDPLLLFSSLAVHTQHIGLITTVGTSYSHPFSAARSLSTLDHLSNGRAGWNVVTSVSNVAAGNYGLDKAGDSEGRYARAREFLDISLQLWNAWGCNAFLADKDKDVLVDKAQIHNINFRGEFFKVCGPLSTPRSPQVVPLICQAGPSIAGRELAADYADLVYARFAGVQDSKSYRDDLRSRAAAVGRAPDSVRLIPYITPFVKSTEAEAMSFYREIVDLAIPTQALSHISKVLNVDLQPQDLRKDIPPEYIDMARIHWDWLDGEALAVWKQDERPARWSDVVRLIEMKIVSDVIVGTPERIADFIGDGFDDGAFDGVSITASLVPHSLAEFVSFVVPLLQKRGVHKDAYDSGTLRQRLGLPAWHNVDQTSWTRHFPI